MKKLTVLWIVLIAASVLLAVMYFLPFASVGSEARELIDKYPDQMFVEEIDMTNSDAADISLSEYFRAYSYLTGNKSRRTREVAIFSIVELTVIAVMTFLVVLFAVLRKAVPVMIFSLLDIGVVCLWGFDLYGRGTIDNEKYYFGFAFYAMIVLLLVLFAGAIAALVKKKKLKKEQGSTAITEEGQKTE